MVVCAGVRVVQACRCKKCSAQWTFPSRACAASASRHVYAGVPVWTDRRTNRTVSELDTTRFFYAGFSIYETKTAFVVKPREPLGAVSKFLCQLGEKVSENLQREIKRGIDSRNLFELVRHGTVYRGEKDITR